MAPMWRDAIEQDGSELFLNEYYVDGRDAFRAGVHWRDNPADAGSPQAQAWEAGWHYQRHAHEVAAKTGGAA